MDEKEIQKRREEIVSRIKEKYCTLKKQAQEKYKDYTEYLSYLKQPVRYRIPETDITETVVVEVPYMTVAGRIKMATDEHVKAGSDKFRVSLAQTELLGDKPGYKVVVETMRGTAEAEVEIRNKYSLTGEFYGIEDAQTSAIGRALGYLGYGLIGGSIASFEEMQAAGAVEVGENGASTGTTASASSASAGSSSTPATGKKPTSRDLMKAKKTLMDKGFTEKEAQKLLGKVEDTEGLDALISQVESGSITPAKPTSASPDNVEGESAQHPEQNSGNGSEGNGNSQDEQGDTARKGDEVVTVPRRPGPAMIQVRKSLKAKGLDPKLVVGLKTIEEIEEFIKEYDLPIKIAA